MQYQIQILLYTCVTPDCGTFVNTNIWALSGRLHHATVVLAYQIQKEPVKVAHCEGFHLKVHTMACYFTG